MISFVKNRSNGASFLERVAAFDFDKSYTPSIRVICHLIMWLTLTFFIQINLFVETKLSLAAALAFAGRSLICNASIFYLFFYFFVPQTLFKDRILLFILSIFFCFELFFVLNHYCIVFIGLYLNPHNPYFKVGIETNLKESIGDVVSPRHFISGLISIFYSLSVFFFIKILFDIVRYYSTVFKVEQKANRLEVEKLNLETDFLKSQLNPHFLFNTLNNLYGMALKKSENTHQVIMQLSSIMRYTLYESNVDKVMLSRELEFIKSYVSLEKLRYNKDARIILDIDASQITFQKISPLLTFTFIENGFKYGLKSTLQRFLEIKIAILDNFFYFSIVNDKEEVKVNYDGDIGGIGIENARRRLELLYPDRYQLTVDDGSDRFSVILQIEME